MRIIRKIRIRVQRLFRSILRVCFGFDRWHLAPLDQKPYAQPIIDYLNGLPDAERGLAVEVGTGLGDILRHLHFRARLGIDQDRHVLQAARFLDLFSRPKTAFVVGSFPALELPRQCNALVMVNWIHGVTPEALRAKIGEYFDRQLTDNGVLILDTVQNPAYKFNHDIQQLSAGLRCAVTRLGHYESNREIWVLRKVNP